METESGAKIAIRGKGSVKEGKGRSDAAHTSNQEEDLHCLIMADTEDKVNKAKQLVHNVIETAASIPEGQNELKRNQLRELAALNGTLRDDENQACQNCKLPSHAKPICVLTSVQAVKSATESTTAPSSATSLPTSSAVFAAMLAIWHEIVQTDNAAATHAMLSLVVLLSEELGPAMLLIERWRTSCRSYRAIHQTVVQQDISRVVKEGTIQLAITLRPRIRGIDRHPAQAMLLLGNVVSKNMVATTSLPPFHPGSSSSSNSSSRRRAMIATTATLLPVAALLLGNSKLRHLHHHKTTVMAGTSSRATVKMATINHRHLLRVLVLT